jgi:heptosyltransferase-2
MLSGGNLAPRSERALILLKPQFIGDAVMAAPLIDALAEAYERPLVFCGSLVRQVLADRADKVEFIEGSKISGVAPVFRAARRFKELGIQHAFLVNRSFRSALAARLGGIPIRVGHATEGRGMLLTHSVPYDEAKFEADCYLDLARTMNVEGSDVRPRLSVTEGEKVTAAGLLDGATIGVQPGARYPNKQVPLRVMAEVCNACVTEGACLALLGGADEVSFAAEFEAMLRVPVRTLVGKLDIRQTMGALFHLKWMLGSDTGLMHLAAAVGAPTVTVFGPNPASKWGHNYEPHKVIEAPTGDINRVTAEMILRRVS